MSVVNELISKVEKCIEGQQRLEAQIVRIDRVAGESYSAASTRAITKALGGAAGAGIGFDGDDLLGVIRYTQPRCKGVGMGGWLAAMGASIDSRNNQAEVHSVIQKRWGCKPVAKTALAEQSGITGGYTVPVQFYADLMRLMAEDSFTRQLSTILPMQSRTMLVPALQQSQTPAVGTSAYFGGLQAQFQPEGSLIANSQPSFRQLELVARDLVFTCVASNQLLADNAVAMDTLLTTLFKESMAWFFDWYMLRGTGANQPLGTLNAPCAVTTGGNAGQTSRQTASQFHLADIGAMMSHLVLSSWKNAVWVCHPSVLSQLIQMTTAADNASPGQQLVWLNPFGNRDNAGPAALASPFEIMGRPVYFSEKVPSLGTTGDVQLVDFSKMLVGDRMAIQIETSPYTLFQNNQLMWRIIERWDAQPWLDNSIILGDGSQTYRVSPIVLLGGT